MRSASEGRAGCLTARERSRNFSAALETSHPLPGYKGFVPLLRGVHGETFANSYHVSRELRAFPSADAMTAEAWTTPRSVRAASRVVLRGGKGPRMDLQELHAPHEQKLAVSIALGTLHRAREHMCQPDIRRVNPFESSERYISYDPGQEAKIDPFTMKSAGTRSIGPHLDMLRDNCFRQARYRALKEKDWPNAVAR